MGARRLRRASRGFTLVELLISVTLMMVAIGISIPFFLTQSASLGPVRVAWTRN